MKLLKGMAADVILWALLCLEFFMLFLLFMAYLSSRSLTNLLPAAGLTAFGTLGVLILAAWRITALHYASTTFERWFANELSQIEGLRRSGVLTDDQANYVRNTWREVTREQLEFIHAKDRYSTTKVLSIFGAAVTACSAGLAASKIPDLIYFTVFASLVTVLATSLRTEYSTDVAEWGLHRRWSVAYQAQIREFLNLTGPYSKFPDQAQAYKLFVTHFEAMRARQVKEFFALIGGTSGQSSPASSTPSTGSKAKAKPGGPTKNGRGAAQQNAAGGANAGKDTHGKHAKPQAAPVAAADDSTANPS